MIEEESSEKTLTENGSQRTAKTNVMDRELNLTEYEQQVRRAHGLVDSNLSSRKASDFKSGSQLTADAGSPTLKDDELPKFGSMDNPGEGMVMPNSWNHGELAEHQAMPAGKQRLDSEMVKHQKSQLLISNGSNAKSDSLDLHVVSAQEENASSKEGLIKDQSLEKKESGAGSLKGSDVSLNPGSVPVEGSLASAPDLE